MQRSDGRASDQIRPVSFELNIAPHATGSVLVSMGNTRVICGVTVEEAVPRWMKEQNVTGGWLTAEYSMLPYSTTTRKPRDIAKGRLDGRSSEIQRLIGRSLCAVVDLEKLGSRTMWIDCDVLQADGGTRTAAITGASLAVAIACRRLTDEKKIATSPIRKPGPGGRSAGGDSCRKFAGEKKNCIVADPETSRGGQRRCARRGDDRRRCNFFF